VLLVVSRALSLVVVFDLGHDLGVTPNSPSYFFITFVLHLVILILNPGQIPLVAVFELFDCYSLL
jgi:hypothetical protein